MIRRRDKLEHRVIATELTRMANGLRLDRERKSMEERPHLARLIRENCDPQKAVETLKELAFDPKVDPAVRLGALTEMMNRGYGQPTHFTVGGY